jgi:hypothetical protein
MSRDDGDLGDSRLSAKLSKNLSVHPLGLFHYDSDFPAIQLILSTACIFPIPAMSRDDGDRGDLQLFGFIRRLHPNARMHLALFGRLWFSSLLIATCCLVAEERPFKQRKINRTKQFLEP